MKKLKIGKSSIHGKGLFSGEPIKKGELIAKVHNGIQLDPETVKYMPTQYGRFYNHDEKGFNTRNEIIGNHRYLRALKNIPANTELTANYREHPEMEQPEDFGKGKYASFDFDKTIATDEGLAKARKMIQEGYNLFIISARDKVTPDMVARARKAGIPEENIIATGSDEAKVRKVKQLGVEMHFDDKPEVISQLGTVGVQFAKKGGSVNSKRYTRSLYGKNKLFVKNNLFKNRYPKNRIYDPNAKYFDNGGITNSNSEPECTDDGRCYETDQIQEMLDRGRDIPKEVLDNAWNVVNKVYPEEGPGISAATAWKNLGVPTLASRLGMTNPSNCMWAAGSGWMCEPEFSNVPKTAFESNDKFINAVNKGTIPFERVTKTSDSSFDSKDKGLLQPGDIINIKGPNTSHAMTFSHYREDGMPIYVDSNGKATDFDWNAGIWSGMKPGNGRTAYVSRFNPEMLFGDKIKELEEKARTNPTYYTTDDQTMAPTGYRTGGFPTDISIPRLNQFNNGGPTSNVSDVPLAAEDMCEEGYAWDDVAQKCVEIPDMKEWFTNWYSNRTLPLDEIQNKKYVALMKERLPMYNPDSLLLDRISELPDPTYVNLIDNNPRNYGQIVYDKDWNASGMLVKQALKGNVKELGKTIAHENSTIIDDPDSEKLYAAQNAVIDPGLVLFKNRWGDLEGKERAEAEEYYDYQTDPAQDNIHSMIFEERFARGLKPDQVITEEDIENWKREAEERGELNKESKNYNNAFYSLLKLAKDNKSLANWFNQLASNEMPVDENAPQYAKQGGILTKFTNGGTNCPMFHKYDSTSGECIPFTEEEKAAYATQYMKDWVQSPMHNEMLKASVSKDIPASNVDKYVKNITDLRLKATNPKVSIKEKNNKDLPTGEAAPYMFDDSIYFDDPSKLQFISPAGSETIDKNLQGEVNYYTKNLPGEHAYVYPHEVSHLQDMGGNLIPPSDRTMMEDYAFTPENEAVYQNMRKEKKLILDKYKDATPEMDKELNELYKKYYPQYDKRYNQDKELYEKDFNKFKVQKELTGDLDNTIPYDEFVKKNLNTFSDPAVRHGYLANDSETRARLNALRMYGKESGIYNPFEEKLSPEKYKELQNLFYQQNPNASDANQLRQLREVYTDEQIFNLLNTISKNEPQQRDEIQTQQVKQGGSIGYQLGDEVDEATMKQLIKLGYTFQKI